MARELVLMQCPVAGFQFHAGELCWAQMRPGDPLALRREPGNRHDVRAVRVEWHELMLGYLPRESNFAVSQMIDRGEQVEARVTGLRAGNDPWSRVMLEVVARVEVPNAPMSTGREGASYRVAPINPLPGPLPRERGNSVGPLPRERENVLVKSLANRIFGAPTDAHFKWTAEHLDTLALAGVEHPALLPFLQILRDAHGSHIRSGALVGLRSFLEEHGFVTGAWKWLEKWGYAPFECFAGGGIAPDPYHLTALGNLLFRLHVQVPPPSLFCSLAGHVGSYQYGEFDPQVFDSFPDWFMRALLRECEATTMQERAQELEDELALALKWAEEMDPHPDANQQHAGWAWIMEQAKAFEALIGALCWKVPVGEKVIDDFRVVPITNVPELEAEAKAMSNCLRNYVEACAAGRFLVFSIRWRLSGKRVACFAAIDDGARRGKAEWRLVQTVGKANSPVSAEIEFIAQTMVSEINWVARMKRGEPG